MDKEDVIEYSGHINTEAPEGIKIPNLEKIYGEFENKYLCKILGTNIRTNVVYCFDYEKIIKLYDEYIEKYSVVENEYGKNYRIFPYWDGCGIKDIDDIKKNNAHVNIVKGVQTIDAQITVSAYGGEAWGDSAFYRIQLFNYNEEKPNFVVDADFIDIDLLCEFLSKLISCIVCVNKNVLIDRMKDLQGEVNGALKAITTLANILSEDIKEK